MRLELEQSLRKADLGKYIIEGRENRPNNRRDAGDRIPGRRDAYIGSAMPAAIPFACFSC
jgi:hypothetical protein